MKCCIDSLYIIVDDLERATNFYEDFFEQKICFPVTRIGKNWVAEFVDSEGNHIEVYTRIEE